MSLPVDSGPGTDSSCYSAVLHILHSNVDYRGPLGLLGGGGEKAPPQTRGDLASQRTDNGHGNS